jgi:hypothetical protein
VTANTSPPLLIFFWLVLVLHHLFPKCDLLLSLFFGSCRRQRVRLKSVPLSSLSDFCGHCRSVSSCRRRTPLVATGFLVTAAGVPLVAPGTPTFTPAPTGAYRSCLDWIGSGLNLFLATFARLLRAARLSYFVWLGCFTRLDLTLI